MFEVYIAKIVFLPNFLNNKFPFMLPSHNCIIIITMFSFQGASLNLEETQWNLLSLRRFSQSLFQKWWAKMDSNHRPHDYQSCALASWAIGPYPRLLLVESTGIEPVTSCLQGRRSPSWANPPNPGILNCLGTFKLYPLNWIMLLNYLTLVLTLGRY